MSIVANEHQQTKNGTPYQQRRSPSRRRRTDFSQFLQSSSSHSHSSSSDAAVVGVHCLGLMKPIADAESPSSGFITAFGETKNGTEDVQKHISNSDSDDQKQIFISDKPSYSPEDKQYSPDSINIRNESTIRKSSRARKLSVRFDKEIIPSKSTKQARRIKILRQLGLAPPAGSPFARPAIIFN